MKKFKTLSRFMALSLGLVSTCLVGFYFHQEKVIFFPDPLPKDFQYQTEVHLIEKYLVLDDATRLNYIMLTPESHKGVLLYFHGNAGNIDRWLSTVAEISKNTGWAVAMIDYPGFGKNYAISLPKTEAPLREMAIKFYDEVRANFQKDLPLVVYGRSLGTGIASSLALDRKVDGLLLESPYISIAEMGVETYPFLTRSFARFHLDNEANLKALGVLPIIIFHGEKDTVIPFRHGQVLSQVSAHIRWVPVSEGTHSNLSSFSEYHLGLINFLNQIR
jgi:pimeloyl-ACP methyl ester carboxylesterase